MTFDPFYVGTCEALVNNERKLPFDYPPGAPLTPFEIADPFGLRKAVIPVFRREADGRIYGMGTAFHVDGWGAFLTADHVIDFVRETLPCNGLDPTRVMEMDLSRSAHAVLLLGIGVVFGKVAIPPWAFAPVVSLLTSVAERDDPLANLRGDSAFQVVADLCGMQALFASEAQLPFSVPVRLDGWQPSIGEYVFAVGYPQLQPKDEVGPDTLLAIVKDGIRGAYGRITDVFPEGRGLTNPTPVFEVEADWQSGMSGGPVFNQQGEVVGIVSRSLVPDGNSKGVGYATCLKWAPVRELMPSLDAGVPGWRVGYGVLRQKPRHLAGVFKTEIEAARFAISTGDGHQVIFGSHRIGSDDFIY
ncbi:serine protease [Collimonas sp. OK307]|uniref:S1 family peptidase n=1 Tax=Collimonas sp. OK307 TaxID=1801620 RepID=UPI001587C9C3|nr:serine protease [Collimonas sp. OK307]